MISSNWYAADCLRIGIERTSGFWDFTASVNCLGVSSEPPSTGVNPHAFSIVSIKVLSKLCGSAAKLATITRPCIRFCSTRIFPFTASKADSAAFSDFSICSSEYFSTSCRSVAIFIASDIVSITSFDSCLSRDNSEANFTAFSFSPLRIVWINADSFVTSGCATPVSSVVIKSSLGFSPKFLLAYKPLQCRRRRESFPVFFFEHFEDIDYDIKPYEVRQLQRTHRMVRSQDKGLVNIRRRSHILIH